MTRRGMGSARAGRRWLTGLLALVGLAWMWAAQAAGADATGGPARAGGGGGGGGVERALDILGEDVPDHLAEAGHLRVTHRQASLEELGRLADPQMTKDAVAGRIRRLLTMADKRAKELGIPATDAAVTDDLLEDM